MTFGGEKVMFDFDLALLYAVETRALNQAVKKPLKRFREDFIFRLIKNEFDFTTLWNICLMKKPQKKMGRQGKNRL